MAVVDRVNPRTVPPGLVAVSRDRIRAATVPSARIAARGAPTLRTGSGNGGTKA